MAKHEWEEISNTMADVCKYGWEPRRRCKLCGVIQQKISHTLWMRVMGYKWEPLVGRCKGASMPRPAIEILEEFVVEGDKPMEDVRAQVKEFVQVVMKKHKPVSDSPDDRSKYCNCCMASDGGSARWPCATVKAVRTFLGEVS